jgi:hypothetical protein
MPRRDDPELIYRTQRAGLLERLRDAERLDELDAEWWIARWEREAEALGRSRGSVSYWDDAWRWIQDQRQPPEVDKRDMSAEGDDGQVHGG